MPIETQPRTHQQFLRFSLPANLTVLVETDRIVELLRIPPNRVVPMPHFAPAVRGIYNWRGEILWIADLAMLLGMPAVPSRYHSLQQIVIIRSTATNEIEPGARGDLHPPGKIGLIVDEIAEIEEYELARIRSNLPDSIAPELARWSQGCWESETEEIYLVLNSRALFDRDDIHAYL